MTSSFKPLARQLRKNQTDAERTLWRELRNRQLNGYKFRRQHVIGNYITDFCCLEAKLIIELDGGQHASQSKKDQQRTAALNAHGYQVQRFWNNEVLTNLNGVKEVISERLPLSTHGAVPVPEDLNR